MKSYEPPMEKPTIFGDFSPDLHRRVVSRSQARAAIASAREDGGWRKQEGFSVSLLQGLVNVPFWEYWTSPEKVAIIDHIPNGWVMWKMGTFNDPCIVPGLVNVYIAMDKSPFLMGFFGGFNGIEPRTYPAW